MRKSFSLVLAALTVFLSQAQGQLVSSAFADDANIPNDLQNLLGGAAGVIDHVQVTGAEMGSGTLVMIGKTPAILTCNHLVRNASSARVNWPQNAVAFLAKSGMPASELKSFNAPVLKNIPGVDVTVLGFPPNMGPRLSQTLMEGMGSSVNFCPYQSPDCPKGYIYGKVASSTAAQNARSFQDSPQHQQVIQTFRALGLSPPEWKESDSIVGISDGKLTWIRSTESSIDSSGHMHTSYGAKELPDEDVTGILHHEIRIDLFAKKGWSGSFTYQNGLPTGMVEEVSVGGLPTTYAIPMGGLAKIISTEFFNTKTVSIPPARWVTEKGVTFLRVYDPSGNTIDDIPGGTLAPAGGPVNPGGGGGPKNPGGGGGPTNPGGWSADQELWYIREHTINGSRDSTFENPFGAQPQQLRINGRFVDYLVVNQEGSRTRIRIAPSSAAYFYYLNHPSFQMAPHFFGTPEDTSSKGLSPKPFQFGRIYAQEGGPDHFLEMNTPSIPQNWGPYTDRNYGFPLDPSQTPKRSVLEDVDANQVDSDGYHWNKYIGTRKTPGLLADVRIISNAGILTVQVNKDLSVKVVPNKDPSRPGLFRPVVDGNPSVIRYVAGGMACNQPDPSLAGAHVIAIANSDDLSKIEHLYFEGVGSALDLVGCDPGKDCVR